MIRAAQPLYHLREGPMQDGDDRIISVYNEMYDAYFEERGLIPDGRLCDVAYEDLEREPVGVIGSVYEALGCRGSRISGPGWRLTSPRSPAIARTGTMNFPSRYDVASPTSGAGASTSGGTSVEGSPPCDRLNGVSPIG